MSDVTRILEAARQGDPTAADQLLPLVHEELRRLAAHKDGQHRVVPCRVSCVSKVHYVKA